MGPLTYNVFNLYTFIRCGTYNSHLYITTLPLKCESIYSSCSPFKRKLLLACIAVAGFSANGPTLLCTAVAAFCANRPAASVVPSSNRGFDTTLQTGRHCFVPPLPLSVETDQLPWWYLRRTRTLIPC